MTENQSAAEALASSNSPITFCDECGEALIRDHGGGHTCDGTSLAFSGYPTTEVKEIVQSFDPRDLDDRAGFSPSRKSKAYHNVTYDEDAGEWRVVPSCRNRITEGRDWEIDTRRVAQRNRGCYPCTICHDLPVEQINERIDEYRSNHG